MATIVYDTFFAIAVEGGLGGNCVLSDETALLALSLIAGETAETLFRNADGSTLTQGQIEQINDMISKALAEISETS